MKRTPWRRSQRGLAAILVSLSMVSLLVIAGMVIDFGIVRYNRQINKATADSAVAAGMQGFDKDDGQVYAFQGVCDAIAYLKTNEPALTGLPAYAPCSSVPTLAKTCIATNTATHAAYTQTTADGKYTVSVQAPYTLPDPTFPEDAYAGLDNDIADPCLQLGVIIREGQDVGLGGLAIDGNINSTIRSVGRVARGPGIRAPALLLLDRHNCNVLSIGTSGNGNSFIHVYGAGTAPLVQPGTIHADSDGSSCHNNETIYSGKINDGIAAYAAPDLSEHGIISSYATRIGVADTVVSDGVTHVYGSDSVDTAGAAAAAKYPVSPLGLITRKLVDDRYLQGLRSTVQAAAPVFANLTSAGAATAAGWLVIGGSNCNGTLSPLNSTQPVYVNCSTYRAARTINAPEVFFSGSIASSSQVDLPRSTRVYVVGGSGDSLDVSGGFRMNHRGNSRCPETPQTESAKLFLFAGSIKNNNAPFQACNTVIVLMSGRSDACLPAAGTVQPPTASPCGGTTGTGQIKMAGGGSGTTVIDWTAPNKYNVDITTLTTAQKQAAWNDQEDLAFWSESWGGNSNPSFQMAGGSGLHLVGVFMTPNAAPFTVTGGGGQTLNNAQYIATSFQVNGGASLTMVVDPNNTVTLPKLTYFNLVR